MMDNTMGRRERLRCLAVLVPEWGGGGRERRDVTAASKVITLDLQKPFKHPQPLRICSFLRTRKKRTRRVREGVDTSKHNFPGHEKRRWL